MDARHEEKTKNDQTSLQQSVARLAIAQEEETAIDQEAGQPISMGVLTLADRWSN